MDTWKIDNGGIGGSGVDFVGNWMEDRDAKGED